METKNAKTKKQVRKSIKNSIQVFLFHLSSAPNTLCAFQTKNTRVNDV